MVEECVNAHLGVLLARAGNEPAGVVVEAADIIRQPACAIREVAAALVDGDLRVGQNAPQLGGGGHTGRHAADHNRSHPSASSYLIR